MLVLYRNLVVREILHIGLHATYLYLNIWCRLTVSLFPLFSDICCMNYLLYIYVLRRTKKKVPFLKKLARSLVFTTSMNRWVESKEYFYWFILNWNVYWYIYILLGTCIFPNLMISVYNKKYYLSLIYLSVLSQKLFEYFLCGLYKGYRTDKNTYTNCINLSELDIS